MQILENYELLDALHQGLHYNVYRARELSSQRDVVLKVTRSLFPSTQEISSLKREMDFANLVDDSGVIKPYSFKRHKAAYFLVQESIGGITLKSYIKNYPIDLKNFLQIAISLSRTLAHIHEKGIIHKDIKPGNIIINPQSGEVKITDFSISTRLSQESASYTPVKNITGSLAYISPEQTGRINRSIDYRSDLYSLGATFYTMLSGRPPFLEKNPIELICKQIGAQPVNLRSLRPSIPEVISKIVHKLLEKNAEDRYQSARGLLEDLEHCKQLHPKRKLEKGFKIGETDYSSRFQIVQKLYGRGQELRLLLEAFNKTCHGKTQSVWISGPPGIGKTALVHEVYSSITKKKGIFITGKFDQYQQSIPYYGLSQALNNLCDYLLGEPEEKLSHWRLGLLKSLKGQGQALAQLIPRLESLIGQQKKLPALNPLDNENRLINTFKNFIKACANEKHPLTLFLDDMQWADRGSLKILEKLLLGKKNICLLFIGAYREKANPVPSKFLNLLDKLNNYPSCFNKISLGRLKKNEIIQMLSDSLSQNQASVVTLAQWIEEKTSGNPFFLKQVLNNLYEHKILKFSFTHKEWKWDIGEIQAQDFSESVVDLLILKISRLSSEAQGLLQLASVLGNIFDLNLLASLSGNTTVKTLNILWEAVDAGLAKPLGKEYLSVGNERELGELHELGFIENNKKSSNPIKFSFAHDRVQEASYATLAGHQRKKLHLKFAQILKEKFNEEDKVFEIISHYQKGASLVRKPSQKINIAHTALVAAQKAYKASAFKNVLSYAKFGIGLLKEKANKDSQDLYWWLSHYKALGEFSTVKLKQCEITVKKNLEKSITKDQKIETCRLYLSLLFQFNRNEEALKLLKQALKILKIKIPKHFLFLRALGQYLKFRIWIRKGPEILINLPEAEDKRILRAIDIIFFSLASVGQVKSTLIPYLTLLSANLSIRYGNSPNASHFYLAGACFCLIISQNFKLAEGIAKVSLRLAKRYPNLFEKSVCYGTVVNFIHHWKNPVEEYQDILKKSFQWCLQSGQIHYAGFPMFYTRFQSIFCNAQALEDIYADNRQCYHVFFDFGNKDLALFQTYILKYLEEIIGKKEPGKKLDLSFDLKTYENQMRGNGAYLSRAPFFVFRLIQEYTKGNFVQALEYANLCAKVREDLISSMGLFFYRFFFLLAYYAAQQDLKFWQKLFLTPRVIFNKKILNKYSRENPYNFLYARLLVQAERQSLKGNYKKSKDLFMQAIVEAEKRAWAFPMALCHLIAGKFFSRCNKENLENLHFKNAKVILEKWGAHGLVRSWESICEKYKKRDS